MVILSCFLFIKGARDGRCKRLGISRVKDPSNGKVCLPVSITYHVIIR